MCVQLCLTLCDPVDCSPPGSHVYWIFQARRLELVAISYSMVYSLDREYTMPLHHQGSPYIFILSSLIVSFLYIPILFLATLLHIFMSS